MASSIDDKSKVFDNDSSPNTTTENEETTAPPAVPERASQNMKQSESSNKEKDPALFQGNGMSFRAKLIGQCQVNQSRGDGVCDVAMNLLKMKQLASRQHKKRINIQLQWQAMQILEEKTNEEIHSHPLSKISYVWKDPSDSRAFGLIVIANDASEKNDFSKSFFAYKTEKQSYLVISAMKDLFKLKQKEANIQEDDKKVDDSHTEDSNATAEANEESLIQLDVEELPPKAVDNDEDVLNNQILDTSRDPWSGEILGSLIAPPIASTNTSAAVSANDISHMDLLKGVFTNAPQANVAPPASHYQPNSPISQWKNMFSQTNESQMTMKPFPFSPQNVPMTSPPNPAYSSSGVFGHQMGSSSAPFMSPYSSNFTSTTMPFTSPVRQGGPTTVVSAPTSCNPNATGNLVPTVPATNFIPTNPFSSAVIQAKPSNTTNPFQGQVNSSTSKVVTKDAARHENLFADLLSSEIGALKLKENGSSVKPNSPEALSVTPASSASIFSTALPANSDWSAFETSGSLLD